MANVLAVVAHPDDEVLGCGGTLAKHAEAGDTVQVIACCKTRADEGFTAAAEALGVQYWSRLRYSDQRLDTHALANIDEAIWFRTTFRPALIYTHWPHDLNLDHSLTARAVLTAFRAPHSQASILAFETLSSTEFGPDAFTPNHWEVLTETHLEKKIRALECYPSEIRPKPHPRNFGGIAAQAIWRGQQICQPYAEAFQILRSIR